MACPQWTVCASWTLAHCHFNAYQLPSRGLSGPVSHTQLLTRACLLSGFGDSAARRVSLVVAWWPPGKQPEPGVPGTGPAGRLARGSAAPSWLASFPWEPGSCADGRMAAHGAPASCAEGQAGPSDKDVHGPDLGGEVLVPPVVRPAWQPVGGAQGLGRADWAGCALPSLRYFLRCESEIARTYVPGEGA